MASVESPEISVVIPCLNEEDAVGAVVDQAWEGIRRSGRSGEVIVVDNASTDRSAEVAAEHGAIVVREERPGYGSAYLAGLAEARGAFIVMGDADETYPLRELAPFVDRLAAGRRPRDGLALRGHDPRGGDAVAQPARRQPDPDRAPQRPLRREDLRRALRDARGPARRARDARPPLDRDGVRLGDGLQGVPARAPRERDPDRLLPAGRRVEAEPLRRRLAAREVHAPLQPELALLRPRARAAPPGRDRRDRARGGPGDAPRSHLADPHALRLHRRDPARARRSSSSGSSPAPSRPRTSARPTRLVELGARTPERRARPRRRRSPPARGIRDRDGDLRRAGRSTASARSHTSTRRRSASRSSRSAPR